MSNVLFADSGHRICVKCPLIIYNNSIISISESFSCIKLALKIRQDKTIKNFYQNKGMSALSTMSSIIFTVIEYSVILLDNNYEYIEKFS